MSVTPTAAVALICALVVLAFVVFYAMLMVFAYATGWRRLARAYRATERLAVERFRGEGAILGEYGWTAPPLIIGIADEALVLIPRKPFRPMFAVLAIPWSEIVATERREYHFFSVYGLTLARGGPHRTPATLGILPTPAAASIEAHILARNPEVAIVAAPAV